MFNPFKKITLAERIEADLQHAEQELLTAEHNVENAEATKAALQRRVSRLRDRLADVPLADSRV